MPGPAPVRLQPLPGPPAGEGEGGRQRAGTCPPRPAALRSRAVVVMEGVGDAEAVPPAAAHLSLSGERRFAIWCWWCFGGKERWGDGRGDSGSEPQGGRPLPGHAHGRPGARPGPVGPGLRAQEDWEEAPAIWKRGFPWASTGPGPEPVVVALLSALLGLSRWGSWPL